MITEQEAALTQKLGDIWEQYLTLPIEHPMDRAEFCSMIHRCQGKILMRSGRREFHENLKAPEL